MFPDMPINLSIAYIWHCYLVPNQKSEVFENQVRSWPTQISLLGLFKASKSQDLRWPGSLYLISGWALFENSLKKAI